MLTDDRLKSLLSDHAELFETISADLNAFDDRLPRDTHAGLLNEAIEKSGIEIDTQRRGILQAAAIALAQLAQSPTGRVLTIASGAVAAVDASVSVFEFVERQAQKGKEEWEVSPAFASQLSRMSYNDSGLDSMMQGGLAKNQGELALLRSYILHRDRHFDLLKRNSKALRDAHDHTHDPNARALIVGRMAIDNNAMGLGRDAVESLDLLDTANVTDQHTLVQCLDYGASILLNRASADDFKLFRVPGLQKLTGDWANLGINLEKSDDIGRIADQFGLHAFTVVLLRKVKEIAKCADLSQAISIRRDWVAETLELAESRRSSAKSAEFAEDAFYSIHRPAFHAFATNDFDGARAICDYYFGRTGGPEGEHMTKARQNILKKMGPGVQWMYLLDAARLANEGKIEDSQKQLAILSENANLKLNYVVMKTAPFVFKKCKYPLNNIINDINQKRSRIPEVSLMRSYTEAVSG